MKWQGLGDRLPAPVPNYPPAFGNSSCLILLAAIPPPSGDNASIPLWGNCPHPYATVGPSIKTPGPSLAKAWV